MSHLHKLVVRHLTISISLLGFSSGTLAADLAKFLPSPTSIGLYMDLDSEGLSSLPGNLFARFSGVTPADRSHPEQIAFSAYRVNDIQRIMSASTDPRYANSVGQTAKDYSRAFAANGWKLVSFWTPEQTSYSFRLTAYLPVGPGTSDGWVISALWTSTNGKRVKGKPDGRKLTKEDLAVAAKLIEKFIQNGRKEGWPN